ncbi:hypothetical protein N7468_007465 [Penicillium chermesinum]|uniref:[histone H3]-trimethyl-L-lysine(9) demethylase n=1 Tax=Penicillium chermesinum TaxID=63820 RepID=A0A9W9NUD7_9EURO|nr:uncharacterized protein N7468_007465 [Penicillium chermesinum]KAJ5226240.1 hypothetical protein N7468_007465 [Penicillium chermesinum]
MAAPEQTHLAPHGAPVGSVSITPPHSANGKKDAPEGVKQENAEATPEIEEEIEPDHFYGGGKIPVFKPTMDQFRDFQWYISKIDKYGMQTGIVKVVPPKEWLEAQKPLDEQVKSIRVKNPIMQEFHGSHGTYTQANIERQRTYNLPQWKALCEDGSHQPPARRGERRRNVERTSQAAPTPKPQPDPRPDGQKRRPGRPAKRAKVKQEPTDDTEKSKLEGPPTPVSPESNPVETKSEDLSEGESLPAAKPKGRQAKSVSSRRRNNRGETVDTTDDAAYEGFDYRIHDNDEYTAERCEELETAYWRSLMFNNPMYGADMPGSLFDDSTTSWNVAKLPNLLDVLGQKVPGVNTAYLYLGMWKATFAWHLEDVDLYSINYIHFGAPKQWYSISQEDAPRFEAAMRSIWSSDAKNCDQFLRHKTYLVSPSLLKSQYGITVNRLVHYEGEFVITFPYGYHSGYNIGYNCAESVNFATEKWLNYARVAKKCNCESDSVWIDVDEIERKLRGEATPEYYVTYESDLEEGFDGASDLLTPPRSVPEKASTRGRKRKHAGDGPNTKRPKLHPDGPRKTPCLLCPNDLEYEELLPTENGNGFAHRRCATFVEETSILRDASGNEVVCDIDQIPKARLGLKCLFCREARGACFQCNFGKCTRAYHATCAMLAGVQVEHGSVAVIADDTKAYSLPSVDLKCKFHRQKRANNTEPSDLDRRVIEAALGLTEGELIQFQADKEINAAIVIQNRPEERTLLVKVLPRGDVIEMPYRWYLVVRKSNFLPLAPGIQPLPAHLARKPDQRDLETALPVAGSAFGDHRSPYQWAEFETVESVTNPSTPLPAVHLDKEGRLWHYLGAQSTESRAQYTHNPTVPVHNPRANFLDSVKSLGVAGVAAARALKIPPHQSFRAPTAPAPPFQQNLYPQQRLQQQSESLTTSNANTTPHLHSRPPFSPASLQHRAPPPPPTSAAGVAAAGPAMPSAFRTLPNQSTRHAPYPSVTKSHVQQQHHLPATNTFANVRELISRRRLAQITDHANVFAGYTIVSPELVVETLLGPMGSIPPANGLEKLELAMAQQRVQPRAADGTLLPPQTLNMRSEESSRAAGRDPEERVRGGKMETIDRGSVAAAKVPGKYAFLDQQRALAPNVYQSPYNMPSGLSEYAKTTYGLVPSPDEPPKPSLANDYFASLSPENQEKIMKSCGSFVQRAIERSASHSRQSSASNLRLSSALAQQTENPTIDITTVEDPPLSGLDLPLHADSPCSSFARSHLRLASPNEFPMHGPDPHPDHHDLFGDQQANTRFWQNGPWVAGDGNTPNEEHRPFFGPHERLKHDYASSDISLGRGPGSLHSVDMAGFGFDGPDDLAGGLSP